MELFQESKAETKRKDDRQVRRLRMNEKERMWIGDRMGIEIDDGRQSPAGKKSTEAKLLGGKGILGNTEKGTTFSKRVPNLQKKLRFMGPLTDSGDREISTKEDYVFQPTDGSDSSRKAVFGQFRRKNEEF